MKSANKRWKESGTTLSFKEWIDRENKKDEPSGNFLPFESNLIEQSLNQGKETSVRDTIRSQVNYGYKPTATGKSVFGINNTIIIFSGILIVGSLGFYFFNKLKSKK